MKIVLIGEAPSRAASADEALLGRVGRKIAQLSGLTLEEYLTTYERLNLLPNPISWYVNPRIALRLEAQIMMESLRGKTCILLGAKVAHAFNFSSQPLVWQRRFSLRVAVVPHPSGRNRFYNDKNSAERVRAFLTELCATAARKTLQELPEA